MTKDGGKFDEVRFCTIGADRAFASAFIADNGGGQVVPASLVSKAQLRFSGYTSK
jgi:hypothetical protein